jgi:hypothetical protein
VEITINDIGIFVSGLFLGALFGRMFTFGVMALMLVVLFVFKVNG